MYWFLVWAGLLIVVLYSPIGSPDLYTTKSTMMDYQTFVPNKGEILNSPKAKYSDNSNSDESDIPNPGITMKSNYSIKNYPSSQFSNTGSSYSTIQSQSYRGNNSISGSQNGGGTIVLAGRSSHSSAGTSGVVMTNGITNLSTTSNISNSSTKQSVTADTPQGGTDPGGDPTGDPIPVGDGWILFMLFSSLYSILKSGYIQARLQK